MKAIVITDNNYRGSDNVNSLLRKNRKYIRKFVKELIAEGKARVDKAENPQEYAKAWLDLGEIVFGKSEKIKVILV
jgi:hypothetical protein